MSQIKRLVAQLSSFFRKRELDQELDAELSTHVELCMEDNLKQGMSPEQARRNALISVGGLQPAKELHRESRGLPMLDTILQDIRYAFRTLRRDSGFAIFAILIIGLGIGASSTIFSVIDAVLLRPLPFQNADRLVWIGNEADNGVDEWRVQVSHFLDLRSQTQSFSDLAAYSAYYGSGDQKLTGSGEPERLTAVPVSKNFFPFLGVQPILGRLFTAEECQQNGSKAALLSYGLWRTRYAANPDIIGQTITLNTAPVTVIGVLPSSFNFGTIFDPGRQIDLFTPFPLTQETSRLGNVLAVIGRLKPGVSVESARAEFIILGKQLTRQYPERNTLRPKLSPLDQRINGRFRPALLVLAWAVGVVMLIVCANLSNLQLARMVARQKEMAIRISLGAARHRLIRQTLTESVVLSCCGAVLGLLIVMAGTRVISHLKEFNIPLLESIHLNATAFSFTVLVAVLTGLLFGLMPALQTPALAVHDALKESVRGSSKGKGHAWVRGALVVSEIALACVLLVGAGLLMRSFLQVLEMNPGFRPEKVAAIRIDQSLRLPSQAQRNAHYDEALRRVRVLPCIGTAALADTLPLGDNRSRGVAGEGQVYTRDQYPQGYIRVISEGYFATLGVPLRSGRDFTQRDTPSSEPVVVINETLARMLWPTQDPLGQILAHGVGTKRRVVGVVGDVRHKALEEGFTGEVYLPIRQTNDYVSVKLVVRTVLPPAGLASTVRAALEPIEPNLPRSDWQTLQQLVDKSLSPRRFVVLLLAGFASFALILASLGIYAVISYSVNQRKQEIGIRMALGASAADLQKRILVQTLRLAAVGIAVGVIASWSLGRAMQGLLFGVTSSDPITFAAMLIVLTAVAALAGYLPARRASRLDPVEAVSAE